MTKTVPFSSICVYCGSSPGSSLEYVSLAEQLGNFLGSNGIKLVFGGGNVGLMGAVARAALNAGGEVIGVIPAFLRDREVQMDDCTELIIVDTMHARKGHMFEKSDAFISLPGGIGTLDETVETLTWRQLGQLGEVEKPVFLLNHKGFWDPFMVLLDHMVDARFLDQATRDFVQMVPDMDQMGERLVD